MIITDFWASTSPRITAINQWLNDFFEKLWRHRKKTFIHGIILLFKDDNSTKINLTTVPISPSTEDYSTEKEIPALEYTDYFIQIYSGEDSISAFTIAQDYKEQLSLDYIYVGIDSVNDVYSTSFKVLIGSYPNRQNAKSYCKQNQQDLPKNSWPRKAHTLDRLYLF